jgi:hypothetical protein
MPPVLSYLPSCNPPTGRRGYIDLARGLASFSPVPSPNNADRE